MCTASSRTGASGLTGLSKTKTVTRKKYERIVQLLNGCESSSTDNAKFKFWVKSKGFVLGQPDEVRGAAAAAPSKCSTLVKTTVSDSPLLLLFVCRSSPAGRWGGRKGEPRATVGSSHPLNPLPKSSVPREPGAFPPTWSLCGPVF